MTDAKRKAKVRIDAASVGPYHGCRVYCPYHGFKPFVPRTEGAGSGLEANQTFAFSGRMAGMTNAQKALTTIQKAQSEKRERLSAIDALPEPTDADTAESARIDTELRALEPEYRDALTAVETEQRRP